MLFQSARPCRARLAHRSHARMGVRFQSTRPCRARPWVALLDHVMGRVSIHAPAQGATSCWTASSTSSASFNPRARAGHDQTSKQVWSFRLIHAPRRADAKAAPIGIGFNPRARAGRDHASTRTLSAMLTFQSTRPRRARPPARCPWLRSQSFNPRARAGRDMPHRYDPALDQESFNPRARAGRDVDDVAALITVGIVSWASAGAASTAPFGCATSSVSPRLTERHSRARKRSPVFFA